MSRCKTCGEDKPSSEFYSTSRSKQCRACRKEWDRNRWLKYKYGITQLDYEKMWDDQEGKCAICKEENTLFVDHNHETGEVRALLCHHCNSGLGKFRDRKDLLKKAVRYLNEYS